MYCQFNPACECHVSFDCAKDCGCFEESADGSKFPCKFMKAQRTSVELVCTNKEAIKQAVKDIANYHCVDLEG